MSEEAAIAAWAVAVALVGMAVVCAIWLSVDSIANCSRSCAGKMAKYTEEPRIGSANRAPLCECAP